MEKIQHSVFHHGGVVPALDYRFLDYVCEYTVITDAENN